MLNNNRSSFSSPRQSNFNRTGHSGGGFRPAGTRPYNPNYRPSTYKGPYIRKPFVKVENDYGFKRNEFITAETVLVIDYEGNALGEMSIAEALKKASEEYELDLIEVSPNAKPPVCRIMSWDKFRYEQSKKQNSTKKSVETKGMWFSPLIGEQDLNHKIERILEFVGKKHPVKIELRVRGRISREQINDTMNKIVERLKTSVDMPNPPKQEGRNLSIMVFPKK
jgi:translation initiation factor IF-3